MFISNTDHVAAENDQKRVDVEVLMLAVLHLDKDQSIWQREKKTINNHLLKYARHLQFIYLPGLVTC